MKLKKRFNSCRNAVVTGLAVAAAHLPTSVWAALPAAAAVADGANTASPLQASRDLVTRGMTIGATVVAAALVLGAVWQIYSSFVKAREKGDWKDMGVTSFVGVAMMVGGVILSILALQYGTL